MDGTSRLSRDGERVYHYCFLSTFAEACVVPERSCIPIPHDVPFDVAALVGCAITTGVGAVWKTAGVRPGDRVAVIGCGGVGLSALMAAVAVGAEPVIAVDMTRSKVDAAKAFGATAGVVWAGSAEATAEAIREVSGGGVDYAIEATGHGEAMQAAVLSTRNRGAAVLIGIPREDVMLTVPARSIPAHGAPHPRLDLRLGAPGSATSPTTLGVYRSGRLPLDRLISHRLPLDEVDAGVRPDALGRGAARRARHNDWRSTMNLEELDGRIGEGWGGLSPNGCHVNVVLAKRGSVTGAAAISMFTNPKPGHSPVLCCVGRLAARVPADLAADADDEQGDRDDARAGEDDLGRGPARDRPGGARLRRRRPDRGLGRPDRARRDLARRAGRRRDGRARGEPDGGAARRSGCASRAATRTPPRSSSPTATRSRTRSTAGTEARGQARLQRNLTHTYCAANMYI